MKRVKSVLAILAVVILTVGTVRASHKADSTLPGGTPIGVSIDEPVDGALLEGPTADVDVQGTAFIGENEATVLYVLDRSGSMIEDAFGGNAGIDCDGDGVIKDVPHPPGWPHPYGWPDDYEYDDVDGGVVDTRWRCAQEIVKVANDAILQSGLPVTETGFVAFGMDGTDTDDDGIPDDEDTLVCTSELYDVDLGAGGEQLLIAPGYDGDGNTEPDIEDAVFGVGLPFPNAFTCFVSGLEAAVDVLQESTNKTNVIFFIADAGDTVTSNTTNTVSEFKELQDLGKNVYIHTIAPGKDFLKAPPPNPDPNNDFIEGDVCEYSSHYCADLNGNGKIDKGQDPFESECRPCEDTNGDGAITNGECQICQDENNDGEITADECDVDQNFPGDAPAISKGSMQDVADLSTPCGGSCTVIDDETASGETSYMAWTQAVRDTVIAAVEDALASSLDSLEIEVDGGGKSTIPNPDISLPLPQPGPVTVNYDTPVLDLGFGPHTIAVTANGSETLDNEGEFCEVGSVTAHVNLRVVGKCPRTQGYWKNHPDAWPVDSLVLGDESYTKAELLKLLKTPVKGDASMILAHQLIATKLNIAAGSDPTPVEDAVAEADALLSPFAGKLPYKVKPSSPIGRQMVAVAEVLDAYNNGDLTPRCTDGDDDGGGEDPIPSRH